MANVFSGNPYDAQLAAMGAAKPKARQNPRQAIEGIAAQYQVPANVLLALDEVAGGQAEAFAKSISAGVKAGKTVNAILSEAIGDPAQAAALMNRAYDIADELYPQDKAPASKEGSSSIAGDMARQLGGSIVKGGGAMVEGIGQGVDAAANAAGRAVSPIIQALTGQPVGETSLGRDLGVAGGDAIRKFGDEIQSGVSPEGRQALMDSTPDGSIFDPSNATFGKNPSLRGYAMLGADVLGSLLPVVATAVITKSPSAAAAVGGAMGGGAGAETARTIVQDAAKNIGPDGRSQLENESALYRELIASGQTPEQAQDKVMREAESLAFLMTTPISAFGGGLTGAIATKPIAGLAGRGLAARAAGTAAVSGIEEGIQEAAETMAARYGTGKAAQMPIDITEGTFGDFILGALGGAPVGALAGAANRRREPEQAENPAASARLALPAPPRALPAPNNGGTIIAPGPVGPGPADPTRFERDPSAPRQTLSDGSGQGQAAPPLSSPIPPAGADGAAAPLGPISAIAAAAPDLTPVPQPAPIEAPPMFSEMKPGAQIRLQDPSGQLIDAVFQREEGGTAVVRIAGQEVALDPQAFDAAVQGARQADLAAQSAAKAPKSAKVKPVKLSEQATATVAPPAPEPEITPEQAAKAAKAIEDKAAKEGWTKGLRKKHENLVSIAGEAYSPKPAATPDVPDSVGGDSSPASGENVDPETGEITQGSPAPGRTDSPVVPDVGSPDNGVDGAVDAGKRGTALTPVPRAPATVDYPNRKLNMRKARAEAPIDGIGDMEDGSFGSIALANAREGDVVPGIGKVSKVTEKQVQITKTDGSVLRLSEGSGTMNKVARDIGALIASSANLNSEQLGSLMDMIERDPALVYRDGVPMLFDDPVEQANRGQRSTRGILKPLVAEADKPAADKADLVTAKQVDGRKAAETGVKPKAGLLSSLSKDKQDRAAELKAKLAAKARNQVSSGLDPEYITLGGELVALYIEAGTKKFGQMLRDFAESTGLSLREAQAPMRAAYNHVRDTMDLNGDDITGMDSSDQVMAEVRKALDMDGKGQKQAEDSPAPNDTDPFVAAGFTIPKDKTARRLPDTRAGKEGYWLARPVGEGRFRVTKTSNQVGSIAIPTRVIGVFGSPEEAIAAVRADGANLPAPEVPTAKEVAAAATVTDPEPSKAQAEAENYRTGKTEWNGLTLSIENKKGGTRRGYKDDGSVAWEVTMPAHYGRILRTEGADGDHVDFYLGDVTDSDYVMIIDQVDAETGAFDEHKLILGTTARGAALGIYRDAFSDGKADKRIGGFTETNVGTLKAWLKSADLSKPSKPLSYPFAAKEFKRVAPAADGEIKAALAKALEGKPVTHITKRGKELTGIIVVNPMLVPAQAEAIDARAFRKTGDNGGGWFIRADAARAYLGEENQTAEETVTAATAQEPKGAAPDVKPKATKPARPKAETLQKRPLIHRFRSDIGQIDPDGTFGKEAYARGMNAQTAPGLFKRGGLTELDNIPADEHPDIALVVGRADDGLYLDQDRLLELMLEEISGNAQPIGQQAFLQQQDKDARDADRAERRQQIAAEQEAGTGYIPTSDSAFRDYFVPDQNMDIRAGTVERYDQIRDAVVEAIEAYGMGALTPAEIRYIVDQLDVAGGSVLAAVEQAYARSILDADQIARANVTPADPDSQVSGPPFGPEDAERYLQGGTDGNQPVGADWPWPDDSGAGSGGQGDTEAAGQVTDGQAFEPGADGKPQAVMPGMEGGADQRESALTARQKAEVEARQKQSKMRRLGGNDGDAGPLFGDGPKDLFDAPSALREPDTVDRFNAAKAEAVAKQDAERFPTTLEEITAKERKQRASERLSYVYAEYRGQRFYLGAVSGNGAGPIAEWRVTFPEAAIYSTDRADGTSINGEIRQLENAIAAQKNGDQPAQPESLFDDLPAPTKADTSAMSEVEKVIARKDEFIQDLTREVNRVEKMKWEAYAKTGRRSSSKASVGQNDLASKYELQKGGAFIDVLVGSVTLGIPMERKDNYYDDVKQIVEAFLASRSTPQEQDWLGPKWDAMDTPSRTALVMYAGWTVKDGTRENPTGKSIAGRDWADLPEMTKETLTRYADRLGLRSSPDDRLEPNVSAQSAKSDAKIEDFGEKIGGARKDVWSGFKDKMEAAKDLDIKAEPLSKSWPEPDYEKLIEAGIDPWTVSFVRAARELIPRKPAKSWKLRGWADQVKVLRDFASDLLEGRISAERLKEKLADFPDLNKKISGKIALYDAVGHGASLKDLSFGEHTYSMLNGEYFTKPRTFWEVTKEQAATAFSNMPKTLARGDTRDEAIAKFKERFQGGLTSAATKKASGTKFLIYSMRGAEGAKYRIGVKIGKNYVDLRSGIADVKEARRIVAEEADQLQATLDAKRTIPNERREENAPRIGADHRAGADVSPAEFAETFGFRGVEFGNWVEQGRRKQDLNDAYDALMDLASILDIPPKAISLNGSLGLAFGARGAGGKNAPAAHFEAGKFVINLTKRSGRGSLAHEWFHALDNYFARKRNPQRGTFITDNNSPGGPLTEGVRPETVDAFLAVKRAIANTGLRKRSEELDKLRSSPYFGTGIEMHARAFESYIIAKLQDQSAANDYLANVVSGLSWSMLAEASGLGDAYPYLRADEIEAVRPKFDALFAGMERRETDKGVALEMRDFATENDAPITADDISGITRDMNAELAASGLAGKVSVRVVRRLISHVTGNQIQGRFNERARNIEVRAGAAAGERGVMRHEIIHALRSEALWGRPGGLFTPAEWRELSRAAQAEPEIVASVMARYPNLDRPAQVEEMVAELYRLWAEQRDGYDGVAKALAKVEAFLQAMANLLRGRGFVSAALTMEQIAGGKVGGRGPQGPGGGQRKGGESLDGAEMRALPGTVREKFKGLVGFRNWRDPKEVLRNITTDAMTGDNMSILALVPGRALFAEMGSKLLSTKRYIRAKEEMDTLRNDWHAKAADVAQKWIDMQKKNPAANDAMMDLMHRSTMTGVDPSKADTWGKGDQFLKNAKMEISRLGDKAPDWAKQKLADEAKRKTSYAAIKALYDALPPEYQAFYVEVKDSYEKMADDFDQALEENIIAGAKIALKRAEREHRKTLRKIEDDGLTGADKDAAIDEAEAVLAKVRARANTGAAAQIKSMRKIFEGQRLKGPYFPLARFGDYFVTVRDENGKVINFSRFENEKRQQVFKAEQEQLHPGRVSFGLMSKKGDMRDQVDPKFVSDVEMLLADSGASAEVMDAIWQRYLETMPDQSIRTSKIHRKGREGFNRDALRSYTSHTFHGAHQLARLKYGLELQDALDDAEEEARRADDPNRATALVNEMRKRMDWTMNPTGSPWSAAASSLAFVWYLGVSPAAAVVNLTQTTVIGPSVMVAGLKSATYTKAIAALGRAAKDFGQGQGVSWKDTWTAENAPGLTDDERAAMKEGYRRGTIDKTQAHDLAAVAESGVEFNPFREKWMKRIGFAFHHAERVNREVTFLAAYRLARADGMNHADAIEKASDLTWKTHFSYQNSDRPRFMQGDIPKVLFIFRQFSVNLLYRLFRDAHQSLAGATKAERKEARTQLVGISLSMMAHAGIKGVWGYSLIMGLLALFLPGDSDDLEEWMQDALLMEGDSLGVAAANYAMGAFLNGIPGQLTGAALTERVGSPNLWFRGSDRNLEGEDVVQHYINELAGPIGGIAFSVFGRGIPALAEGEVVRGVEALTPKFVRDVIRTGRFAAEGATTRNGDTLIENVNPWELILQANGFTPARLAERYDINTRLKNKEKEITDQRKDLHRAASDAIKSGVPIPEKVMEKIRDFNKKFPEYPITGDTIRQSFRGRMRASERNEFGVSLNPKLNDRLRGDLAPSIYN